MTLLLPPPWVWSMAAAVYLVAAIANYAWHARWPYGGVSRWLAIVDLAAITALAIAGWLPTASLLSLRYLQLVLLFISIWQTEMKSVLFAAAYFGCFLSASWANAVLASSANAILEMAGEAAGAFVLCSVLVCYGWQQRQRRQHDWQQQWQRLLPQVAHQQNQLTQMIHRQDFLVRQLSALLMSAETVAANRQSDPCWQALCGQRETLLAIHATIIDPQGAARLAAGQAHEVVWQPMVQQIFRHARALRAGLGLVSMADDVCQLHIYRGEETPERWRVADASIWQWVIWSWFDYLLVCSNNHDISLWASQRGDECYLLKAVTTLAHTPVTGNTPASKCLLCGRHVRQLYQLTAWQIIGCRDCLKTRAENRLQQDWETPQRAEVWPENSLWLSRELLNYCRLGNVYYGIQNLENWEYFVTLSIRI